jgi:hypothetical protein
MTLRNIRSIIPRNWWKGGENMVEDDGLFPVEINPVYDKKGLLISTVDDLFAYIFRGHRRVDVLLRQLPYEVKIWTIKRSWDRLAYDRDVAIKGLRRERQENEKIRQLKLL